MANAARNKRGVLTNNPNNPNNPNKPKRGLQVLSSKEFETLTSKSK